MHEVLIFGFAVLLGLFLLTMAAFMTSLVGRMIFRTRDFFKNHVLSRE